jgi:hypothetical protein
MPEELIGEVVIRGVTLQGRTFRPSDWADRLAGICSHVSPDNRLNFSPDVQPITRAGVRCVVINSRLAVLDSRIFKFLLDFARENDLEVVDGRKQGR